MGFLAFFESIFESAGYFAYLAVFFILLLCGFGLPVPEDITLVAGGVAAGLNPDRVNPHLMFLISFAGVLMGDGIMFALGRIYGERILKVAWIQRIVTPERYVAVQEAFEKYGKWVLFAARFMPGLRSPIFLIAGITRRVPVSRFLFPDGSAALLSVPIWVYLGYWGAFNREMLMVWIHRGQTGILGTLGVASIVVVFVILRRRKNRQALQKQLEKSELVSKSSDIHSA